MNGSIVDIAAHLALGALFSLGWAFSRTDVRKAAIAATLTALVAGIHSEAKEEGPALEWSDFAAANWSDVAEYALGGLLIVPLVHWITHRARRADRH